MVDLYDFVRVQKPRIGAGVVFKAPFYGTTLIATPVNREVIVARCKDNGWSDHVVILELDREM